MLRSCRLFHAGLSLAALALLAMLPRAVLSQRADELPAEVLLLSNIKAQAASDTKALRSCGCVLTIAREARDPGAKSFRHLDTVDVNVVDIDGRESYSWPATPEARTSSLSQLIGTGFAGTGVFATFAETLFVADAGVFKYAGRDAIRGQAAVRYDFQVAAAFSGLQVNGPEGSGSVAMNGSVWADPDSRRLLRLEIGPKDIPPGTGVRSAKTVVEYSTGVLTDDTGISLPSAAIEVVEYDSGREDRNVLAFSHCRRLANSSTPAPEIQPQLPAGLVCPSQLETAIDSRTSRVGDPITASVTRVLFRDHRIVVPVGAVLSGRIRILQRDGADYIVGLEFDRISFGGKQFRFLATLESISGHAGVELRQTRALHSKEKVFEPRGSIGSNSEWTEISGTQVIIPPDLPGVGTFFVTGASHFKINPGLRMEWLTTHFREPRTLRRGD